MSKDFSFDETLEKIEEINCWFEGNDYKLDKALEKYKEAAELISKCKKHLEKVENEFKKVESESDIAPAEQAEQDTPDDYPF